MKKFTFLFITILIAFTYSLKAQNTLRKDAFKNIGSSLAEDMKSNLSKKLGGDLFRHQDRQVYFWLNDSFWMQTDSTHYTYYPNGQIHTSTMYTTDFGGKNHPYEKHTYTYDANTSNTLQDVTAVWSKAQNAWKDTLRIISSYTTQGDLTQEVTESYDDLLNIWSLVSGTKYDYTYNTADKIQQLIFSEYITDAWQTKYALYLVYNNDGILERDTCKSYQGAMPEPVFKDSLMRIYTNNERGEPTQVAIMNYVEETWEEFFLFSNITWQSYNMDDKDWLRNTSIEESWAERGTWSNVIIRLPDFMGGYIDLEKVSIEFPDNFGSYILTDAQHDGTDWIPAGRESYINDEHSQPSTYRSEYYDVSTGWNIQSESNYQNTYDANNNITIAQRNDLDFSTGQFKNAYKTIYSNYINLNTTGVNRKNSDTKLVLYPNPAYGKTQLNLTLVQKSSVTIELMNTLGQTLKSIVNNATLEAGEYRFDINLPTTGLYLLKTTSNNQTIISKLINQ